VVGSSNLQERVHSPVTDQRPNNGSLPKPSIEDILAHVAAKRRKNGHLFAPAAETLMGEQIDCVHRTSN
jgi:hypothetical protein